MEKILYIYSPERLENLKDDFNGREFINIGFIFNMAPTLEDIEDLEEVIDDFIVDITILAFDNGYYKLFIQRYLCKLIEHYGNNIFLVNHLYKEDFLNKFLGVFNSVDEKYVTKLDDSANLNKDISMLDSRYLEPIELVTYSKSMLCSSLKQYNITSIGCFFNANDNLSYNFSIDDVKKLLDSDEIQYIDITQVINLFKFRKDLILSFETLLRQIFIYKVDIKFLICDENLDDMKNYLPFTFKINNEFFIDEETILETSETINKQYNVEKVLNKINNTLKGHDDFKKDFEFSLKKYRFLNEIKERKIFSIFLTGESGIGKTEFAKMLSDAMYPSQNLIKINFGNYSNEGVLNSLIGSPKGYLGSEEGGELINKMKNSKSKIVLIDEFEKATPSVFNFFYELLEDGKFTDRHGEEHDMDGYIIIFTSNISKKGYVRDIPDPLKSRFDMVYYFNDLSTEEKSKFIIEMAEKLIEKIFLKTEKKIEIVCVEKKIDELIKYDNLRILKRKVEDIIIREYYSLS